MAIVLGPTRVGLLFDDVAVRAIALEARMRVVAVTAVEVRDSFECGECVCVGGWVSVCMCVGECKCA